MENIYLDTSLNRGNSNEITSMVMPDYSSGVAISNPGNTPYEIPSNGYVNVLVYGTYMNDLRLKVNDTIVWQNGDDINGNTKWASGFFPVNAGDELTSECVSGHAFETITINFYPCKGAVQ